jgi:hypothetical protein
MVTMDDLPPVPALLAVARDVLVSELMPLLPKERHADARLVADAMAIAERAGETGNEPMQAISGELETLYRHPLTHPAPRAGSTLSRSAGEGAEQSEAGEGEAELLRRFARDLREGALETSDSLDRAAQGILWRLTIARLRQSNPNFLAANGFD